MEPVDIHLTLGTASFDCHVPRLIIVIVFIRLHDGDSGEPSMLDNQIILIGGGAFLATFGFAIGIVANRGQIKALTTERNRLRAFIENAGLDLKGLRQIGQELTTNAASISSAAAKMVQLADAAEGTTTDAKAESIRDLQTDFGTGPCLKCSCSGFLGRDYGKKCQRCGHQFSDHHYR